jgi:hypothetical protein
MGCADRWCWWEASPPLSVERLPEPVAAGKQESDDRPGLYDDPATSGSKLLCHSSFLSMATGGVTIRSSAITLLHALVGGLLAQLVELSMSHLLTTGHRRACRLSMKSSSD